MTVDTATPTTGPVNKAVLATALLADIQVGGHLFSSGPLSLTLLPSRIPGKTTWDSFIHPLIHSLIPPLIHSFIFLLIPFLISSLSHLIIHSYSFIPHHSLNSCPPFIHSQGRAGDSQPSMLALPHATPGREGARQLLWGISQPCLGGVLGGFSVEGMW